MDDDEKIVQDFFMVDGFRCPSHTFLAISSNVPALLNNSIDARFVRNWLRTELMRDDAAANHWLGHLWLISDLIVSVKTQHKQDIWMQIKPTEKQRRVKVILSAIDNLVDLLQEEDLPIDQVKAFDLFESWGFFYCLDNSLIIHDFAVKNNVKPLYADTMIDFLRELKKRYEHLDKLTYGRKEGIKNNVGDMKERELANSLNDYLTRSFFLKRNPVKVITSFLTLSFDKSFDEKKTGKWLKD